MGKGTADPVIGKLADGFESHLPEDWSAIIRRRLHVCEDCHYKTCRCPTYQDQADKAKPTNDSGEAIKPCVPLLDRSVPHTLENVDARATCS